MKIRLMDPTRIALLKLLPILVFTAILLLAVGVGIADPTTHPPPPIGT